MIIQFFYLFCKILTIDWLRGARYSMEGSKGTLQNWWFCSTYLFCYNKVNIWLFNSFIYIFKILTIDRLRGARYSMEGSKGTLQNWWFSSTPIYFVKIKLIFDYSILLFILVKNTYYRLISEVLDTLWKVLREPFKTGDFVIPYLFCYK